MIETKAGETAGISGIWNPEGWPEPEVGWVVFDGFEGRSIAYEAACRVRRWAYEDLGFKTITSNITYDGTHLTSDSRRTNSNPKDNGRENHLYNHRKNRQDDKSLTRKKSSGSGKIILRPYSRSNSRRDEESL